MTSPAEIITGNPVNAREISSEALSIPRPARYCLSRWQKEHFQESKFFPQCTHIGLAAFDPTDNRPPHSHNAMLRQCAHSRAFPYPFRGARKRTGPSFSAARISEKIRPGNNAPSVGVNAFTSILSREVKYLICRFSISNPTSIDGENPVRTSFSFSWEARS